MGKGLTIQFKIHQEKLWEYLRDNFGCSDSLDELKKKIPFIHTWVYNESLGVIYLGSEDVMKFHPNQRYEIKSNVSKDIEVIIGFVRDPQSEYSSYYNLGIQINNRLEIFSEPKVISYFPITDLNIIMSKKIKKTLFGNLLLTTEKYNEGYKAVEDHFSSLGYKSTRDWSRERDNWDPLWQFKGEYGQITIDYKDDLPISNIFTRFLNWANLPRF